MALYHLGRLVYSRANNAVGEVVEANYGPSGKATYVVAFEHSDWLCGSSDLTAFDYRCDACGQVRAGRPYMSGPDGEYPYGIRICFPCGKD